MLKKSNNKCFKQGFWCVVSGQAIHLQQGQLPFGDAHEVGLSAEKAVIIGTYQQSPVYWLNESDIDATLAYTPLRELLTWPQALFLLINKAVQYAYMTQTQRFCPQCGGRNHLNHNQIAMQCGDCRTLHYPRIFPCIIVAVRKEKQILLAQHPRHKTGMYTVIAGFLEVGETLEQCVQREVKEETGIVVDNIRYFGSQPWPFPTSMMMGFLADYREGDLKLDYTELADANWFDMDAMPEVAPVGTIARQLIEQTKVIITEQE